MFSKAFGESFFRKPWLAATVDVKRARMLDYEITLKIFEFILNSVENVNPAFLLS